MRANRLFVTYHNFKSPKLADWCDLKGMEISSFREQIEFLLRHYEPITIDMLIAGIKNEAKLPEKCFYLTFDEGSKEHFLLVMEELLLFGIKGSFFCNTQRLEEKKLLTVDKQRFLMYATGDFRSFLLDFCETIRRLYPGLYNEKFEPTSENINDASTFCKECSVYSNEERFYRKIRNTYLSEDEFKAVVNFLFSETFNNEAELLGKYFMDWDDLRCLAKNGMDIGCHTYSHPILPRLSYAAQKSEIHKDKEILTQKLGIEVKSIAYPYAKFNQETIQIAKEEGLKIGFAAGFMETNGTDRHDFKNNYQIPRLAHEKLDDLMHTVSAKL